MVTPAAMLAVVMLPLLMTPATAVAIIVMRQCPVRGREHPDADRCRENPRYDRLF
jgi:hypothetical protein